jgi:hypothetical protein
MEREEKHKQLFLSFHSPLGISQKARDSHIPTARHRPGWKSGKPKTGFPLSHAGLATTATVCPDLEPKTKKGDRPLRGLLLIFQDHLVLETETDFRSILRLENARLRNTARLCRKFSALALGCWLLALGFATPWRGEWPRIVAACEDFDV